MSKRVRQCLHVSRIYYIAPIELSQVDVKCPRLFAINRPLASRVSNKERWREGGRGAQTKTQFQYVLIARSFDMIHFFLNQFAFPGLAELISSTDKSKKENDISVCVVRHLVLYSLDLNEPIDMKYGN